MGLVNFIEKDDLGYIILNRPEKRNALSLQSLIEFKDIVQNIKKNTDVSVIIIKGKGKDFCAGHDLVELKKYQESIHDIRNIFTLSAEIMQDLHVLSQPIIAQVKGNAYAAGCQLVAACDLAIADSTAYFCTPGVKIGLFCSTPMVPLVRCIGRKKALEMLFTGEPISAEVALSFGLINKMVSSRLLEKETVNLAAHIGKYSQEIIGVGKKAFYRQIDHLESDAYLFSKEVIALNCFHADAREGINAHIEKRKSKWDK